METGKENEIVLYQPNETVKLEVRVQEDSVWLTQQQIADLFGTKRPAITKHLKNIYSSGELEESSTCSILELMGNDGRQMYSTKFYNLDAILSVGYRVNSINATAFRRWANQVLKEYLLRGYAVRQQLQAFQMQLDARFDEQSNRIRLLEEKTDLHSEKIDFFIRTNLPPVEGVLFEGQVLDARLFAENLIKTAQKEVILIDNYIDASDFDILECRNEIVDATIFVERITPALLVLQTDCLVQTGRKTELRTTRTRVHDRFLIIDSQVYHLGASLKDLGRKLFAFSKMGLDKELLLGQVI
jgi:prophage antirepressor-like protein